MKTKRWNLLSVRLIFSVSIFYIFILTVYTTVFVIPREENLTGNNIGGVYQISFAEKF